MKACQQQMWENSPLITRQLEKIGPVLASNFLRAGVTTFRQILDMDAGRIEMVSVDATSALPPFFPEIPFIPRFVGATHRSVAT